MDEAITALRQIAELDGKTISTDAWNTDLERFAYRTGAHFAFEYAAKMARKALAEIEALYCDSDPRLKNHEMLGEP